MPNNKSGTEVLKRFFLIDFDSTFVKDEGMEILAGIALNRKNDKEEILKKMSAIADLGMTGKISISESQKRRLKLFSATKKDLDATAAYLASRVSLSIERNREFFLREKGNVYIVSSGFKDLIAPVVKSFGIDASHILANSPRFDKKGTLVGVMPSIMAKNKAAGVKALKLSGEVIMIGDGMTDYDVKKEGAADVFFAFTENIARPPVIKKAEQVVKSFDEILYHYRLPRAVFYPHGRLKVLLLENIHPYAEEYFLKEGCQVRTLPNALSEEELVREMKDVSILGIRSTTKVTERVLNAAPRLLAIGAFCIGTNQIDLLAAARRGVAVFNEPYSNGRSVVELIMGLLVMLARGVGDKSSELHSGQWNKSAAGAHELRGKTLGVVGFGNIGSQVSMLAQAFGMNVVFYDAIDRPLLGNARRAVTIPELLRQSDAVSVHVDGRPENNNLFGKKEFALMKKGALFVNLSRGHVADIAALAAAIKSGHLGGAAIDVFPEEPKSRTDKFRSPLQGLRNVILTPHIGGSTEEAQVEIARFLSQKLMSFIDKGDTGLSVNLPNLQLPALSGAHRFLHIHRNVPGILAGINTVLSENKSNIVGQYLGTTSEIGYVITDATTKNEPQVIEGLNAIPGTLRVRTLY